MVINRDPNTGQGQLVNAAGEALTKAIRATIEHTVSSRDGQCYHANTADTADTLTVSTGETVNMIYLQSLESDKQLVIEKINGSADTAGLVLKYTRNPVLGTVGANNVHIPPCSNFGSGNTADVLCHTWDESGSTGITGLTGGTELNTRIMGVGPYFDGVDGFIVLERGNSILITVTNNTGGDVEVEMGIRFYFDRPAGT